jgi:hypothetical protein
LIPIFLFLACTIKKININIKNIIEIISIKNLCKKVWQKNMAKKYGIDFLKYFYLQLKSRSINIFFIKNVKNNVILINKILCKKVWQKNMAKKYGIDFSFLKFHSILFCHIFLPYFFAQN